MRKEIIALVEKRERGYTQQKKVGERHQEIRLQGDQNNIISKLDLVEEELLMDVVVVMKKIA